MTRRCLHSVERDFEHDARIDGAVVTVIGDGHAGSEGLTLHRGLHDAGRVLVVTLVVLLIAAAILVPLALLLAALVTTRRGSHSPNRQRTRSTTWSSVSPPTSPMRSRRRPRATERISSHLTKPVAGNPLSAGGTATRERTGAARNVIGTTITTLAFSLWLMAFDEMMRPGRWTAASSSAWR